MTLRISFDKSQEAAVLQRAEAMATCASNGHEEDQHCRDAECLVEKAPLASTLDSRTYGGDSWEEEDSPKLLVCGRHGQYPALDMVRIMCVCLVVVDHGGTDYGHWNTGFVQSWVLQWLFLTSGICYGITSRGLCHYLVRLSGYLCAGVFCNFMAFVIVGERVKGNLFNVVFQFWFIVGLMLFLMVLTPIKKHLHRVVDQRGMRTEHAPEHALLKDGSMDLKYHPAVCVCLVVGGFCTIYAFSHFVSIPILQYLFSVPLGIACSYFGKAAHFWGLPQNTAEARDFIAEVVGYFQLSVTCLYLIAVVPLVSDRLEYTGWIVILNVYAHRMILYRSQCARCLNSFDLTMIGVTCFYYGLAHRRSVGGYMSRFWFLILTAAYMLWPPGTYGRYDEDPPKDLVFRMRYNLLEAMFTVMFLCCLERLFDRDTCTEDRLQVLGMWSLLLFLVHKAVHMVFPCPFNWLVLFSLLLPCFLIQKSSTNRPTSDRGRLLPHSSS